MTALFIFNLFKKKYEDEKSGFYEFVHSRNFVEILEPLTHFKVPANHPLVNTNDNESKCLLILMFLLKDYCDTTNENGFAEQLKLLIIALQENEIAIDDLKNEIYFMLADGEICTSEVWANADIYLKKVLNLNNFKVNIKE
ncbi:hypothetical protein JTI58_12325 [Lysinibacillus fusiformis]|uniref:hypothetical protein n=1 Tax=Lysinibacillus fusiformis TaxID=28031 RepID=UPI001967F86D|nr:hypothetical protein [Lysinibacillus fusiformis]QSB07849.1 hypothetical protein JTI58_12325 [Lysinibacillus fusiformis]